MSNASWVGQSVSWCLIVGGWLIVNHQNNKRETRKEIRASLTELYKHLDNIEDTAFQYHENVGDPLLARKIRRDIHQIAPRIKMAQRGPVKIQYASALKMFRESITLKNFDTKNFVPKQSGDPIFDEIAAAKSILIGALEGAYFRAYPN